MKKFIGLSLIVALFGAVAMPMFAQKTTTVTAKTTATGYTKASDVDYVKSGKYIANWGAREETCVFLSEYAVDFYTGSYSYDQMWAKAGGSGTSNAPSSALYKALQSMMKSKHTYETSYNATRDLFCYTDCVSSNYSKISSFYSGKQISGTWDGGKTWNREHTWPNSKGDDSGNGENDIIMLRPTSVSENSSRGNTAYGESGSYYDPNELGQKVRGDCARTMLFVYTRWGNTGSMWGSSGVMESLNVLLKWMEEDPVDTWEMGRNDAVQAITGTRNVFVDYPEYAWKLFGKSVPTNMVTPSGKASNGTATPDTPVIPEDSSSSSSDQDSSNVGTVDPEIPAVTSGLEEGVAYVVTANNKNGPLYLMGTITGSRFNCSTNPEDAVPVYVENVSGGQLLYMKDGNTKQYFVFADKAAGGSFTTSASSATVFEWNDSLNTLVVAEDSNNRAFGAGKTSDYENFSSYDASNTDYNWGQFIPLVEEEPEIPDSSEENSSSEAPEISDSSEENSSSEAPEISDSSDDTETSEKPSQSDDDRPSESVEEECQHQFGKWFTLEPATKETTGLKTHFCELCGYEEQEEIPVLTDDGVTSDVESESDSGSGDSAIVLDESTMNQLNVLLQSCQSVIALPMLGIGVLVAGGLLLKRKEDEE